MKWLVGTLTIVFAVVLYSIYVVHFERHSDCRSKIGDNWEKHRDSTYLAVGLALDALLARHDGKTNDFEHLLSSDGFDRTLKKVLRHYEDKGNLPRIEKTLKVIIYGYVINLASDLSPPGQICDSQTISLFRRIRAAQPTLSDISIGDDVETIVADHIERSIREYEAFHAGLLGANQMTNGATHAKPSS